MTARWTCSICAWHLVQVAATRLRWMLDSGSSWGRMLWEVWQEVQTAVTVSHLLNSPYP